MRRIGGWREANGALDRQGHQGKTMINCAAYYTQITDIALATKVFHEIKLPTIKLENFSENIETWSRLWEQFESSVDRNQSVCTINKHVFSADT